MRRRALYSLQIVGVVRPGRVNTRVELEDGTQLLVPTKELREIPKENKWINDPTMLPKELALLDPAAPAKKKEENRRRAEQWVVKRPNEVVFSPSGDIEIGCVYLGSGKGIRASRKIMRPGFAPLTEFADFGTIEAAQQWVEAPSGRE